ncbi:glycoside hydrolase family 18 protein [Gonapodya prolifera JEL478]|uniref:Glycoside hydrolase family 18 protein n=1 Tax=Gonapodya prolifera (strain JEL478) TaxID=1344416 RepID=A0A138ZYX9_GONPJ|nr:glycoside hydrolase family 18 protein [Gonapodya prolifera JEL478]|eukprot:KXS09716.1 glycoside hydrolase family 18 protein [Gonapodya prolifera JEL478]
MYSRGSVSSLNLTNVSVLYWAFWTVNADGSIRSVDQWADFQVNGNGSIYELNQIVKPKYPGLKTMLTIGGWTLSSNFSAVAASEQARATFAQSCLDAVGKYGFDGIEIDVSLPFPSPPNDPTNLASLLTTLRSKLTPEGHLISLAVSATGSEYVSSSSIACIAQQTDWLNILAYDLAGSWDAYTGFLAPLERIQGDPAGSRWSLSEVVDKYVSSGVDRSKLALGVAMYGRSVRDESRREYLCSRLDNQRV